MTNEHNFKVGDRVRVKFPKSMGATFEYDDGTIEYILDNGQYKVVFEPWGDDEDAIVCDASMMTLLESAKKESCDRRTAFLKRLQKLMREFDASFDFYDVYGMEIIVGEKSVSYNFLNNENHPIFNADNVMDFDKS